MSQTANGRTGGTSHIATRHHQRDAAVRNAVHNTCTSSIFSDDYRRCWYDAALPIVNPVQVRMSLAVPPNQRVFNLLTSHVAAYQVACLQKNLHSEARPLNKEQSPDVSGRT